MEPINQGQSIPTLNPAEQIQPIASSASSSKNTPKVIWGVLVMLIILLVASIGLGAYFFQKNSKSIVLLQKQISDSEQEKVILQEKIKKGLGYAKLLDLYLEPIRAEINVPKRYDFSDMEWVVELDRSTKVLKDSKLDLYLETILDGDENNVLFYTERATNLLIDSLK